MLKPTIFLVALATLAGCAGTRQAVVEPVAPPAPVADTASVSPPVDKQAPEPAAMLEVADVTPAQDAAPAQVAVQPAIPDPYQCMLAWAKGMQDALAPWAQTAQACDARSVKP